MAIPQSKVCLLCNEYLNHYLSMKQIFSFKSIEFPVICPRCEEKFTELTEQDTDCQGCGRHLDEESDDIFLKPHLIANLLYCYDCVHWLNIFSKDILNHRALFDYDVHIQHWITEYKYKGDVRMAYVMAPYLKVAYQAYKDYLWVVLPSSPNSLTTRLFHPTAYLLEVAKIPYVVLHHYVGDGIKQAHKTKKERMNLAETYRLKESAVNLTKDKILLFDDIYTTGATMNQAKNKLYQYYQTHQQPLTLRSLSIARDQLIKP